MPADVQDILRSLAFTRDLEQSDRDRLLQVASPVQWDAGTMIFREGDQNDSLYLVMAGRIALEISVPIRGRVRILTVGTGEVFGWSSVFYEKPKTALATALEPTEALAFDASRLRELCDADPGFGYRLTRKLLQVVSDRLKATRMQALDVFAADPAPHAHAGMEHEV